MRGISQCLVVCGIVLVFMGFMADGASMAHAAMVGGGASLGLSGVILLGLSLGLLGAGLKPPRRPSEPPSGSAGRGVLPRDLPRLGGAPPSLLQRASRPLGGG